MYTAAHFSLFTFSGQKRRQYGSLCDGRNETAFRSHSTTESQLAASHISQPLNRRPQLCFVLFFAITLNLPAMTTYESLYYSNPGQERLRLWTKEKKPEIEQKFKEMKRDINAELGQRVRDILRRTPYDHYAIMNACQAAQEEEAEVARLLSEGVEAETVRMKTVFMHAALNHPGESDPTEEVRERIKSDPQAENAYCSPILVETLLWEGQADLPNTHRRRLELDFPDRVEALLEFHCIAFHADVNILKELYDDDMNGKENRKEVLANHRAKMEALMASYAEEMSEGWAKEKERLHSAAAAQSPLAQPPARWETNDWMTSQPSPPNNAAAAGAQRRAHMTNPPTILGAAAEQRRKTAQSMPLRGILKNASAGASAGGVPSRGATSNQTVAVESLTFDEGDDDDADFPGSFFRGQMIVGDTNTNRQYLEPDIAVNSPGHQQYASTSRSYELYRPRSASDAMRGIPRAANGNNVAQMTQRFEAMENGKGKGKERL
ncbi:hypothetical protein MVEN_01340400 [Mycena venus]|uniref:Uncharacterized protein n=1 Tax=Mycena venus TaxID=2733690 RepID=A0A8H6Y0B3_9AGAR|nr:hypothetical protein MVEN_01340400 [Mycena venus]